MQEHPDAQVWAYPGPGRGRGRVRPHARGGGGEDGEEGGRRDAGQAVPLATGDRVARGEARADHGAQHGLAQHGRQPHRGETQHHARTQQQQGPGGERRLGVGRAPREGGTQAHENVLAAASAGDRGVEGGAHDVEKKGRSAATDVLSNGARGVHQQQQPRHGRLGATTPTCIGARRRRADAVAAAAAAVLAQTHTLGGVQREHEIKP